MQEISIVRRRSHVWIWALVLILLALGAALIFYAVTQGMLSEGGWRLPGMTRFDSTGGMNGTA
jgi:hypothetical protein